MSKAQTDIRSTSYDELAARPHGYVGTIEDVLAQIRAEPEEQSQHVDSRTELLHFLGVDKVPSGNGPNVEDDQDVRYGAPDSVDAIEPGITTLAYALRHFPQNFVPADLFERLDALTESQRIIYVAYRREFGIVESLVKAEGCPYPATTRN